MKKTYITPKLDIRRYISDMLNESVTEDIATWKDSWGTELGGDL